MNHTLLSALIALPCIIAIFLSYRCINRLAGRILRWAGIFFLLTIMAGLFLELFCKGSLVEGFAQCAHPLITYLEDPLLHFAIFGTLTYLTMGPVLIVVAIILETRTRTK